MRTYLFIRRIVILTSLVLITGLPALTAQAVDQPSGGTPPFVSTEGFGSVASGAVEDTLKACLTRIPKDASIGQRLFAETSCNRDEMDRKVIQVVPETEHASK